MARERFIKSDLAEGLGVEGKQPNDTKAGVDEESGTPLTPKREPAPDERDVNRVVKEKKRKSFDRLAIKEQNDANIFR